MARTTSDLVQGVLGDEYGLNAAGSSPSLTPYIRAANLMVTRVAACATLKNITLSTDELTEIETWLAAHMYQCADPGYTSRSTDKASGSFTGQFGLGLDGTRFGQMAQSLDPSGCLAALSKRQYAGGTWLGKAPSEQTDYEQRD